MCETRQPSNTSSIINAGIKSHKNINRKSVYSRNGGGGGECVRQTLARNFL